MVSVVPGLVFISKDEFLKGGEVVIVQKREDPICKVQKGGKTYGVLGGLTRVKPTTSNSSTF